MWKFLRVTVIAIFGVLAILLAGVFRQAYYFGHRLEELCLKANGVGIGLNTGCAIGAVVNGTRQAPTET